MFGFWKKNEEVPVAEAKAEGQNLEWGQDFAPMTFIDVEEKLKELNDNLLEGERVWRLPTKDELVSLRDAKAPNVFYWSGDHGDSGGTYICVNLHSGETNHGDTIFSEHNVRFVRDSA